MNLSILIPARNEIWLKNTIDDIFEHIEDETEVIVGLDGQWWSESIEQRKNLTVVYFPESIGQRAMTNRLCSLSRAKYVMKVDAHCAFDQGFDRKLIEDMNDNWLVVPVMKNLHVFDWVCECGFRKYQGPTIPCPECGKEMKKDVLWRAKPSPNSTSYRFDRRLEFKYWGDYKKKQNGDIVDTMSLQGSCFMITREKYWELNICDESWGSWGGQGTEISAKTRTYGMEVKCNKKTWYAHLFRTQGKDFGFPYPNPGRDQKKAKDTLRNTFLNNKWEKQIFPLSKIIDRFYPIEEWEDEDIKNLKSNEEKVERSGIYSIVNEINNKIYIGSTINFCRRFKEHKIDLKNNKHENKHLQNSWNKYGEEVFNFNIEIFCSEDELVDNEQLFFDTYKELIGWDNMYNINPTANSTLGYKHTEEAKAKMGRNMKGKNNPFYGKKHSKESRKKMSKSLKGNIPWNKGKKHSDKTREKISRALKGKDSWCKGLTKETDERLKKISENAKGKCFYKEHPKGMLGKKHTEETKNILSKISKEKVKSKKRSVDGKFIKNDTKGIIFYTDNQLALKIAHSVQKNLRKMGLPITSASLKPMNMGNNIHIKMKRGREAYYTQILSALEACEENIIFFCEHDILYHPSHFDFIPPEKDKFYFNINVWKWNNDMKYGVKVDDCKQVSGMCCYRDLALDFYRNVKKDRHYEPQKDRVSWSSEYPNIDIRHNNNLTKSRWSPDEFRNKKYAAGWTESKIIPGWPNFKGFNLK